MPRRNGTEVYIGAHRGEADVEPWERRPSYRGIDTRLLAPGDFVSWWALGPTRVHGLVLGVDDRRWLARIGPRLEVMLEHAGAIDPRIEWHGPDPEGLTDDGKPDWPKLDQLLNARIAALEAEPA